MISNALTALTLSGTRIAAVAAFHVLVNIALFHWTLTYF